MEDKQRLHVGGHTDWMSRLPEQLLDVPLWNLAIPGKSETLGLLVSSQNMSGFLYNCPMLDCPHVSSGSHDSMSFCLDVSSPVLKSESRLLRVMDRLIPCWIRPCVSRWATTQVHRHPTWHSGAHNKRWRVHSLDGAMIVGPHNVRNSKFD